MTPESSRFGKSGQAFDRVRRYCAGDVETAKEVLLHMMEIENAAQRITHDMAEAMLLAEFARRRWCGQVA